MSILTLCDLPKEILAVVFGHVDTPENKRDLLLVNKELLDLFSPLFTFKDGNAKYRIVDSDDRIDEQDEIVHKFPGRVVASDGNMETRFIKVDNKLYASDMKSYCIDYVDYLTYRGLSTQMDNLCIVTTYYTCTTTSNCESLIRIYETPNMIIEFHSIRSYDFYVIRAGKIAFSEVVPKGYIYPVSNTEYAINHRDEIVIKTIQNAGLNDITSEFVTKFCPKYPCKISGGKVKDLSMVRSGDLLIIRFLHYVDNLYRVRTIVADLGKLTPVNISSLQIIERFKCKWEQCFKKYDADHGGYGYVCNPWSD